MPIYSSDSEDEIRPQTKLFGRRRPIRDSLGGGKVADVLLWKDKKVSGGLVLGLTVIWFLFEAVKYKLRYPFLSCLHHDIAGGLHLVQGSSIFRLKDVEHKGSWVQIRCNTSLLIDCFRESEHSYIIIDVGKTFREQVLRWFTFHRIPRVDCIILTHEHADAVLGLDDIRSVQPHSPTNDIDPTSIFVSQFAMDSLAVKFPYLVKKKLEEGQEIRRVAQLNWQIIDEDCQKPFVASGVKFFPLPVMHGEDYVCLGFLFGEKSRIAYISDVSRIPPTTEYAISKTGAGQLDLLILDTLYRNGSHNTHFCFPQTLEAVKRLCPKRALLVGMTHQFDHSKDNDFLAEWSEREGIPVQLAHDGLRVSVDL